jgi:hypothetical protein
MAGAGVGKREGTGRREGEAEYEKAESKNRCSGTRDWGIENQIRKAIGKELTEHPYP